MIKLVRITWPQFLLYSMMNGNKQSRHNPLKLAGFLILHSSFIILHLNDIL